MSVNIDLTKPDQLPAEFKQQLHSFESLFKKYDFSEKVIEDRDVNLLVKDINKYCSENRVIGVHYTRAVPDSIQKSGLLLRSGDEIRRNFLEQHGSLFSESEIYEIKKRWAVYFNASQRSIRDLRIFFNFTEVELGESGSECLLGLYGGEQVSMCFELNESLGIKLGQIGQPIVVRCALDPEKLITFTEHPWGEILVSSAHLAVNPNAYRIDQDAYQELPVSPDDIIEIRVLEEGADLVT